MPSVPRVRLGGSRAGRAGTREERAGRSVSEGRRRAAILSREEFGLQAEGENRRTEPLRPGLSGFMAALKTRGTARAWGECSFLFPHVFLACFFLSSFFVCSKCRFPKFRDLY
jgi:hypothetical protein